jgi:hypothetical protein
MINQKLADGLTLMTDNEDILSLDNRLLICNHDHDDDCLTTNMDKKHSCLLKHYNFITPLYNLNFLNYVD